jgi:GTPase
VNFVSKKHFSAGSGHAGQGGNRTGGRGEDMILKVPVGTLVYDNTTGDLIADLMKHGQRIICAMGGRGGKGNANFTTSVRQAPDFSELGEPGEEKELRMELKLIADVAIIGYPNAGKSTLISRISNARPKIADYPFTTLAPHLGVVKVGSSDFVVADIPGLIEGAHEGKGLGIEFLKHIERTKILVHLLDVTRENPRDDFDKLNQELKLYSKELAKKPQIVAISKIDASIPEIDEEIRKEFKKEKPLFISAVSGEGIDQFLYKLKDQILKLRETKTQNSKLETLKKSDRKVFKPHLEIPDSKRFTVEKTDNGFRVAGKRIEQLAVMTNMSQKGAVVRMHDILKKIGAYREMTKLGGKEGDNIYIADRQFEFIEFD